MEKPLCNIFFHPESFVYMWWSDSIQFIFIWNCIRDPVLKLKSSEFLGSHYPLKLNFVFGVFVSQCPVYVTWFCYLDDYLCFLNMETTDKETKAPLNYSQRSCIGYFVDLFLILDFFACLAFKCNLHSTDLFLKQSLWCGWRRYGP